MNVPILKRLRVNKNKSDVKEVASKAKKTSVQQWLPLKDVAGDVIHRKDGTVVAVLRVLPYNFGLKSKSEKKRTISAVHEALNGQREPLQILCQGRPVDLDKYLRYLESLTRDRGAVDNPFRRRLLQKYLKYVSDVAAGGEALERRYYILVPQAEGGHSREEVIQRAFELKGKLEGAGLTVDVCNEQEIIDLLFCFTHPVQAAFERPPDVMPKITTQT
ncbi:MAG: conjugal transfer protein TraC [Firmicutes bacterium]|nr:conjugal transfer protein TraC [Bacillota bacterium]